MERAQTLRLSSRVSASCKVLQKDINIYWFASSARYYVETARDVRLAARSGSIEPESFWPAGFRFTCTSSSAGEVRVLIWVCCVHGSYCAKAPGFPIRKWSHCRWLSENKSSNGMH